MKTLEIDLRPAEEIPVSAENEAPPRWDDHPSFAPHKKAIEEMERAYHMRSRWELELMRTIQRLEELGTHREMGYEQIGDFVCSQFGLGHRRACELVEIALCLRHLPKITSAYERGCLSYDHLRALVQVAAPENEDDLLDASLGKSVSATFRLVRKMTEVSKEDSVDARRERRLETSWDLENRQLLFWGQLPEDMGIKFEKRLDRLARELPPDPLFGDDHTPLAVKRADALYQLVTEGSELLEGTSAPSQVVVHVEAEALLAGVGVGELEGGPTVAIETVKRLMCDSQLQAVVHDSDGKPIGYGRARRTAPPKMKREMIYRDRTCSWSGCRNYKLMDAHHIDEYERDQGSTDYDNMVLFCEHHHYLVDEGGYRVVGVPPSIVILPPEGKDLPPIRNGPPPMTAWLQREFENELEKMRGPDDP